jgi:hypothetical protein
MNAGNRFGIWVSVCGKAVKNTNTHGSKELKTRNTMLYQQQCNPHKTQTRQNESVNEITSTKGDRAWERNLFRYILWMLGNE